MSDELLVQCASPTLAGIKTGNLFTCKFDSKEQIIEYLRNINRSLVPKGIRVIPLRFRANSVLIYLYRPACLKEDLNKREAKKLLKANGYSSTNGPECIVELISRLERSEDFPHEIGLFLGYPPEDVRGFMEGRKDYKCIGCWKVYGDEDKARQVFARFKRCRDNYRKQFAGGKTLDSLAVSLN